MEKVGSTPGQKCSCERATKLLWVETLKNGLATDSELKSTLESEFEAHKAKNSCKPGCVFCKAYQTFINFEKDEINDKKQELRSILSGRI